MSLQDYIHNSNTITAIEEGFFNNIQALPDNVKYNLLSLQQSNVPWSTLRKLTPEKFYELFRRKSLVVWVAADFDMHSLGYILGKTKNDFRVSSSKYGSLLIVHSIDSGNCKIHSISLTSGGTDGLWYNRSAWSISQGYGSYYGRNDMIPLNQVIELFGSFSRKVYNDSARMYVVDAPSFDSKWNTNSGFCFNNLVGDFLDVLNRVRECYKNLIDEVKSCCHGKPTKTSHHTHTLVLGTEGTSSNHESRHVEFALKTWDDYEYIFYTDTFKMPWVESRDTDKNLSFSKYFTFTNNTLMDRYYIVTPRNYEKIKKLCNDWTSNRNKFIEEYHKVLDKFLGKIESNPVPETPTPAMTPIVAYVSPSGRRADSKEQVDVNIFDVYPNGIEQTKALKLLGDDKKSVNPVAYAKFLKLSNTRLKVSNRTHALIQHIKDNGGDIKSALEVIRSSWTGYFTLEQIFGSDLSDIDAKVKEFEKVLD